MKRAALVTGASRNIGRAIALALARDGFPVACFGRDKNALMETEKMIRDQGGVASVHVGDATSEESLEQFAHDAARQHGGIAVVVNNAGVMREEKAVDATPASFRRSEEHTSELQSRGHLVCRLLLEKKNTTNK